MKADTYNKYIVQFLLHAPMILHLHYWLLQFMHSASQMLNGKVSII